MKLERNGITTDLNETDYKKFEAGNIKPRPHYSSIDFIKVLPEKEGAEDLLLIVLKSGKRTWHSREIGTTSYNKSF